jgi:hypothetical protein
MLKSQPVFKFHFTDSKCNKCNWITSTWVSALAALACSRALNYNIPESQHWQHWHAPEHWTTIYLSLSIGGIGVL